ncbi:uncharacterized protein [Antedon mediterranea]|uniref:uncharacterized protein n=1 Tax=Antedon mediterranea TaxID=105859 RepID=UPI003AF7D0B2
MVDGDVGIFHSYDDHLSNVATPPQFVKGLGRGKQIPVDPRTIRLPKFLINKAKTESGNSKKNGDSQVEVKIKNNSCSTNEDARKYVYDAKSYNSRYDAAYFDWHIAKLRNAEKTGNFSSSHSSQSSMTADISVASSKHSTELPSIDSTATEAEHVKDLKSKTTKDVLDLKYKSTEDVVDFKSIGKLLGASVDSASDDGCHGDAEREVSIDKSKPQEKFQLCVQNIPSTLSEADLVGALSTYGAINECQVFHGAENNSMAIVTIDCEKACKWAISCLHDEESPFPGYEDGKVPKLAVFQITKSGVS